MSSRTTIEAASDAALLAVEMVILQQPVDLRILGKADIAQEMRRAVPERGQLPPVARSRKPGAQATEPAGRGRLAWKSRTLNSLFHDRLVRFRRPKEIYVSMQNLPSTFRPYKLILRGRA